MENQHLSISFYDVQSEIIRQIGYCMGITTCIRYWVLSTFDIHVGKSYRNIVKRFNSRFPLENKNEIRVLSKSLDRTKYTQLISNAKYVTAV